MPVYLLSDELLFPPPEGASPEGVVAVGGDCSPERLLLAYREGIFPWPTEGFPLLWFSPDPRFVIQPTSVHVPRSLKKRMRKGEYEVRADTAFADVVDACAERPRAGQSGTWITEELKRGFRRLHERGFAHSIEAYADDQLVGGLYGLSLGGVFFGESMFAIRPDASKVAFVTAIERFRAWDFDLVDCQVHTEHLARFGAVPWPRSMFRRALESSLRKATRRGPWTEAFRAGALREGTPGAEGA